MNRHLCVAALALVLAPSVVAAQQDPAARIEAAKQRVASAGIPVSLLDSRVAEGRAKGVPMDRIAAAVERRAGSLERAKQAMSGARGLSEADLSAGADAVEAGIDAQALRTLISRARTEDRAVAIAVLTYLSDEQDLPVAQALARVIEALDRGPDALRALPTQAGAAAARRGPPQGAPGRPDQAGQGRAGSGPPTALPAPGNKPGAGKPAGKGRGGPPGGAI